MRSDVGKEHKEMFMDILNMKRQAILAACVHDSSTKFFFAARVLPNVVKFATKIKKSWYRSKEQRKVHAISLNKQKFFSLNKSDIVVSL